MAGAAWGDAAGGQAVRWETGLAVLRRVREALGESPPGPLREPVGRPGGRLPERRHAMLDWLPPRDAS